MLSSVLTNIALEVPGEIIPPGKSENLPKVGDLFVVNDPWNTDSVGVVTEVNPDDYWFVIHKTDGEREYFPLENWEVWLKRLA